MVAEQSSKKHPASEADVALAHLRHEFRTPINSMLGYSQLVLEELADGNPDSSLRDVEEQLESIAARSLELLSNVNAKLDGADTTPLNERVAQLRVALVEPLSAARRSIDWLQNQVSHRASIADSVGDFARIAEAVRRFDALLHEQPSSTKRAWGSPADAALALDDLRTRAVVSPTVRGGTILVVDDLESNRELLARRLDRLGHRAVMADCGAAALAILQSDSARDFAVDLVLLDIHMPGMSGFEVLARLKAMESTRDIPVIVVSAADDTESAARGIELGADDYLPKPVDPILLSARIRGSLERKRWHDLELEYLHQVEVMTAAASSIEDKSFVPETLGELALRPDALGRLARVFLRMAEEVHAREQRLERQLEQLRLDIAERSRSALESIASFVPIDRRIALAEHASLPENSSGAVLFADISGFTPLTEELARGLGLQRGAEEVVRHLNQVYAALIDKVHRFGGSVTGFSGDAITCCFDAAPAIRGDVPRPTLRALACAFAMQSAMRTIAPVLSGSGESLSLRIKIAICEGEVRRFLVGDPQRIEVVAGQPLVRLAVGERLAGAGEVLVEAGLAVELGSGACLGDARVDATSNLQFVAVSELLTRVSESPWDLEKANSVDAERMLPWVLTPVYDRIVRGDGCFLAELREATALFVRVHGLGDFERNEPSGARLDATVRWIQSVLCRRNGHLLQVSIDAKGTYLYGVFGAPGADDDDAGHAVEAALELQTLPPELSFITGTGIGLARGQMRVGSYGSSARCTYGVLGDKVNLAARLMQASNGTILCDESVCEAAGGRWQFEPVEPLRVKGKTDPITVARPVAARRRTEEEKVIEQSSPRQQMLLKLASLLKEGAELAMLQALAPEELTGVEIQEEVDVLCDHGLLCPVAGKRNVWGFVDATLRSGVYDRMLFSQRRQLHRLAAQWYEQREGASLSQLLRLVSHWESAEDWQKTLVCLERAGDLARQSGDLTLALALLDRARKLETRVGVLSEGFRDHGG